jgi:hypothetical protein
VKRPRASRSYALCVVPYRSVVIASTGICSIESKPAEHFGQCQRWRMCVPARLVGGDQFFVAANATYSKRGTAMPRCFHQKAPKDIDATTISAVRFNTTRLIQALMGERSSLSSATIANKSLSPSRPCAAVIPIAVRDVECSGVQRHGRIPLS